jgi:hypothetical protein
MPTTHWSTVRKQNFTYETCHSSKSGGLAHSSVDAFVALTIAPDLPLIIKPHVQALASTPSGMRPIGVEKRFHCTSAEHRNQRYLGYGVKATVVAAQYN